MENWCILTENAHQNFFSYHNLNLENTINPMVGLMKLPNKKDFSPIMDHLEHLRRSFLFEL